MLGGLFEVHRNGVIYRPRGSLAWRWMLCYRDRRWLYRKPWGAKLYPGGAGQFMLSVGLGYPGFSFHWQKWVPRPRAPHPGSGAEG